MNLENLYDLAKKENVSIYDFYFDEDIRTGEIWGKYEKNDKEITSIYIIPKILKDFLSENNVNFNGVKSKFFNKKYIVKNSNGEYTIPTRVNGTVCRCIKIIAKPEMTDLQYEQQYEQQELTDLPF